VIPNPLVFIFVAKELLNWFYYHANARIAIRLYMMYALFIGVDNQIEIITNRNEVVHPFYVFVCVKLGFDDIETAG
jgi:hypothetical protein